MDPRDQLDEILPRLTALVAGLDDAQFKAPTPCQKFAVRDVIEHMIGGASMFAAAFRGEKPVEPSVGGDRRAAFGAAMTQLREALDAPDALGRTIHSPFGDMPGDAFARLVAMDGLIHGWDIATATKQPYNPPSDVVAAVDSFARQALTDDLRDGDTFAAAVEAAADASPMIRLAAFTGRKV
ncbi:MAG TPA: TIGR03086 family metal-binding protein [Acidimicrobiales bacterium]|nr:TIGR03086 family metal-binding protein [Acidimicrobiales bacterium]